MPGEQSKRIPLGNFLSCDLPPDPQRHMLPFLRTAYKDLRAHVRQWEVSRGEVSSLDALPVSWRREGGDESGFPHQSALFPLYRVVRGLDFNPVAGKVFNAWATNWRGDQGQDKELIEIEPSSGYDRRAVMLSSHGEGGIVGAGSGLEEAHFDDRWVLSKRPFSVYYMHPGLDKPIGEGEIPIAARFFYAMTLETIHGRDRVGELFEQLTKLAAGHSTV